MCKIAWNISKVMWIKCKVAWISDRLREFGSRTFLKKESLRATLQKNGQNRDSCDSDSRTRHNPISDSGTNSVRPCPWRKRNRHGEHEGVRRLRQKVRGDEKVQSLQGSQVLRQGVSGILLHLKDSLDPWAYSKYSGKRLQWHPLKSEFFKNRGRYHKMVLGHHRGIS